MKKRIALLGIFFLLSALLCLVVAWPASADQAVLTWVDMSGKAPGCTGPVVAPCDQEDGFIVERQVWSGNPAVATPFSEIFRTGVDAQTFTDNGSSAGSCYRVAAFNTEGVSAFSNTACRRLVPPAPGGNKVTATTKISMNGSQAGVNVVLKGTAPGINLVVAEVLPKQRNRPVTGSATLVETR